MIIQDAHIYLRIDCRGLFPREGAELCREAVQGGADVVELGPGGGEGLSEDIVTRVAEVCRAAGALLVICDEPSLARDVGAGVHLTRRDLALDSVRSMLQGGSPVGVSSRTPREAVAALEPGPDYLLHFGGLASPAVFAKLQEISSACLFAAGVRSLAEAQQIVANGVRRLCLDIRVLPGSLGDSVAELSRLVGVSA